MCYVEKNWKASSFGGTVKIVDFGIVNKCFEFVNIRTKLSVATELRISMLFKNIIKKRK